MGKHRGKLLKYNQRHPDKSCHYCNTGRSKDRERTLLPMFSYNVFFTVFVCQLTAYYLMFVS